MAGRIKDPSWDKVTSIIDGKVSCKSCGIEISGRIARIKTHLSKCEKNKEKDNAKGIFLIKYL
jgi:hypothetical protein